MGKASKILKSFNFFRLILGWLCILLVFTSNTYGQITQDGLHHLQDSLVKKAFKIRSSDPLKAIEIAKNAFDIAESIHDESAIASIKHLLAIFYIDVDQQETAMKYLMESLEYYERQKDQKGIARLHHTVGLLYTSLKAYRSAIEPTRVALKIHQQIGDAKLLAASYNNIGECFLKIDSLSQSLENLYKALEINKEIKDGYQSAINESNIALVWKKQKRFSEALELLKKNEITFKKLDAFIELAESQIEIGTIYLTLNQHDVALRYFDSAEQVASKIKSTSSLEEIYFKKATIYDKLNLADKSLLYKNKGLSVQKSLPNTQSLVNIQNIRSYYEARQQKYANERRNKRIKTALAVVSFILVLTIFLFLLRFFKLKKERLRSEEKINNLLQVIGEKNKKLTTNNLKLIEKNDQLSTIRTELVKIENYESLDRGEIKNITNMVSNSLKSDKNWEEFKIIFEQTHENFFSSLRTDFKDISPSEMKLAALLKLGFSTKEICNILNINPNSAKTARWKLRKKLNLNKNDNLQTFLSSM